jgi:hypothetical protein
LLAAEFHELNGAGYDLGLTVFSVEELDELLAPIGDGSDLFTTPTRCRSRRCTRRRARVRPAYKAEKVFLQHSPAEKPFHKSTQVLEPKTGAEVRF